MICTTAACLYAHVLELSHDARDFCMTPCVAGGAVQVYHFRLVGPDSELKGITAARLPLFSSALSQVLNAGLAASGSAVNITPADITTTIGIKPIKARLSDSNRASTPALVPALILGAAIAFSSVLAASVDEVMQRQATTAGLAQAIVFNGFIVTGAVTIDVLDIHVLLLLRE
jgi:hypothetical protein